MVKISRIKLSAAYRLGGIFLPIDKYLYAVRRRTEHELNLHPS